MYKYGIIGFGGLGKKHLSNLMNLERERGDFCLSAICGTTLEEAKKGVELNLGTVDVSSFDFSGCNFYDDYKEMIEKENLDFVFSVLPTYLHEEVAVYALSAGLHVFSEKPMALSAESCQRMIDAANKNNRCLMIGQCLRFHSAYAKVKEYIDSGCYGKVRYAAFERNSQMPLWTWNNWILDADKSGGCVLDMHIHDVDLINWFFGRPDSINAHMGNSKILRESISSTYHYGDFAVDIRADWSLPQTFPFKAICRVDFDEASVVVENDSLSVYKDSESFTEEFDPEDAFVKEIKAFVEMVADSKECNITSPESVYDSVKIALKEIESAQNGKEIVM